MPFVRFLTRWLLILGVISLGAAAWAQAGGDIPIPSINIGVGGAKDRDQVSTSLQILALMTVLAVAPAILILTTAFTRIVIVLGFVRSALGTQNIPPTQVLVGLSLFLTIYVMAPTYEQVHKKSLKPYMEKKIGWDEAVANAEKPVREFMLKNTYESDLLLFLQMREKDKKITRENVPIVALIPAFVISELKTAFIIGFYIFVPFIIIDLVVASVLMGMGMMMMPPVVVSLPAKLLVFVLADGWSVLVRTLIAGYT